jgi:hypothetical protein
MKSVSLFLTIALTGLLTGCITLNSGSFSNSGILNSAGFHYLHQSATGSASTSYFLMLFGGNSRNALVADAKADLSERFPLKANQAYVNTTVNIKNTAILFGIYTKVECVVSADIVEFTPPAPPAPVVVHSAQPAPTAPAVASPATTSSPVVSKPATPTETYKKGDLVVFTTHHLVGGVSKKVQINEAMVDRVEGDKLTISYKYIGKWYQIEKNQSEVIKKVLNK